MFSGGISGVINSDDLSGCEGMEIKELQVNECTFFFKLWREWNSLKSEQCPVLESFCSCLVALLQVVQVIFVRVDG